MTDPLRKLPLRRRVALAVWAANAMIVVALLAFALR